MGIEALAHPPRSRSLRSAWVTAAVDTPSPRASSLWLAYTPSSSIRCHSLARHPTALRGTFSTTRLRTSSNPIRRVLPTSALGVLLES
jgi:hypothetical protein